MNVHKKFFGLLIHKIKFNNLNYLIMRKVYVLLGTCKQTNQSWVVGVYSSLKKAEAARFINYCNNFGDISKFEIINEVLI